MPREAEKNPGGFRRVVRALRTAEEAKPARGKARGPPLSDSERVSLQRAALGEAVVELKRLHVHHTPRYEGKLGEPDKRIITRCGRALNRTR